MYDISINQLLSNPELHNEENAYGFYDWFCHDKALKNRGKKLFAKLKVLVKEGLIDGDTHYVCYKNNYGSDGLYDDMRFHTMGDGDYVGGLSPSHADYWLSSEDFAPHNYESFKDLVADMKATKSSFSL